MTPTSSFVVGLFLSQTLGLGPGEAPAPVPVPAATVPAQDTLDDPDRRVPEDGRGSVATGGVLLGMGAAMLGGGITGAALGAAPETWAPFMATSAVPLALGGLLVGVGRKRMRSYEGWSAVQGESIPDQGNGLRSPGIILVALGSGATAIGGILTLATRVQVGYPSGDPSPPPAYPLAILATGATALAVGIGLTAVGEKRRKNFERWRHAPELAPVLAPMPGGAQLGLSGRF